VLGHIEDVDRQYASIKIGENHYGLFGHALANTGVIVYIG
jgi:hypothetical protein